MDLSSAALDGFDRNQDVIWMAEVASEAVAVWNHKARIAIFLSAMRHFRDELQRRGYKVDYYENEASFTSALAKAVKKHKPAKLIVEELRLSAVPLEVREDRHFMASVADFRRHADGRKQLRLEYFYREMRRRYRILMDRDKPMGHPGSLDDFIANRLPYFGTYQDAMWTDEPWPQFYWTGDTSMECLSQ